jgi:hypothetical protein
MEGWIGSTGMRRIIARFRVRPSDKAGKDLYGFIK